MVYTVYNFEIKSEWRWLDQPLDDEKKNALLMFICLSLFTCLCTFSSKISILVEVSGCLL